MTCCQTFLVNWIGRQVIIRKGRHDKRCNHNRYECCGNTDGKQCWIVHAIWLKEATHCNNCGGYWARCNTDLARYNGDG